MGTTRACSAKRERGEKDANDAVEKKLKTRADGAHDGSAEGKTRALAVKCPTQPHCAEVPAADGESLKSQVQQLKKELREAYRALHRETCRTNSLTAQLENKQRACGTSAAEFQSGPPPSGHRRAPKSRVLRTMKETPALMKTKFDEDNLLANTVPTDECETSAGVDDVTFRPSSENGGDGATVRNASEGTNARTASKSKEDLLNNNDNISNRHLCETTHYSYDPNTDDGRELLRQHNQAVESLQQTFERQPNIDMNRKQVLRASMPRNAEELLRPAEGGGHSQQGEENHQRQQQQQQQQPSQSLATGIDSGGATPSAPGVPRSVAESRGTSDEAVCAAVQDATRALSDALMPFCSPELKEKAMEELQDGITIADFTLPNQPLIYCNSGFVRMTGYSKEMTIGRNCRFLQGAGTDPASVATLRNTMFKSGSCVVQLVNYRFTGEAFINYLSLTPITNEGGQLTHYVGIQSDITELLARKAAEMRAREEAAKAEAATESKSKFLANMSHEIRTPLNGMIAVGQMLAEGKLTPAQRELVTMIRSSGEVLLSLITDILDFSRIEANKLIIRNRPFNVIMVIESAIEIAGLKAAQKKINLAYYVHDDIPKYVKGDANRLQQILLNLLNNAVKFTEYGEVLLEVRRRDLTPSLLEMDENISNATENNTNNTNYAGAVDDRNVELQFSIRDTGIGISEEGLARLFISFSQVDSSPTRRFGGTGLGLVISRKLCEAMGGRMWADSQGLGRGSKFHFCVRVARTTDADVKKEASPTPGFPDTAQPKTADYRQTTRRVVEFFQISEFAGKHVLLNERCEMVREVLCRTMRSWGMRVTCVENEQEAITCINSIVRCTDVDASKVEKKTGMKLRMTGKASSQLRDSESNCDLKSLTLLPSGSSLDRQCGAVLDERPNAAKGEFFDVVLIEPGCSQLPVLLGVLADRMNRPAPTLVHTYWPESPSVTEGHKSDVTPSGALNMIPTEACDLSQYTQGTTIAGLRCVNISKPIRQGRLLDSLYELLVPVAAHTGDDSKGKGASVRGESPVEQDDGCVQGKSARILIAEDNQINLKVALGVLKRMNIESVTVARDGIEVLEKVHDEERGPDAFDVILMDLHMPRMGGIEATTEMRRLYPDHSTPVVAVTADAFEDSREKCKAVGFSGLLAKPFRIEELAETLKTRRVNQGTFVA